jgi:hypothetical protein
MDVTTLLIAVYCTIDEGLSGRRLRQRGPKPTLSDSEVLTIECVGEFLGIDTDKGIYEHFRRHYRDWFPALSRVHRTTFTRQAANLWAVKAQLRQRVLDQVRFDPAVSILDSFPMPVCRFGRADRCRRLAELAAFGRDEGAKQTFYGLRAHLRGCWLGRAAWRWATEPIGVPCGPSGCASRGCGCWRRRRGRPRVSCHPCRGG